MKKLLIFFFLVFSVGKLSAQFTTMFNDTLRPFGSGAYSIDNIQKDDSFYYATGIFAGNKTNNKQQLIILKIDYNGVLKDKKLLVDSLNSYASYYYNSLIIDNNKLIQLNIRTDTLNRDLGTIIVLNKSTLDTLWTKTYTHPDTIISQTASDVFSVLTAIKATPDGGYILTGNYNKNCVTGNLRSFLMKIDSVGNVLWRKTYGNVTGLYDIELTNNGGYVFLNPFGNNVNKIAKTDSIGNIEWQLLINSGMGGWSTTSSLAKIDSNTCVGAETFTYDSTNDLMGFNVFKININSKQIIWDKTYILYHTIECISLHQGIGIKILTDGNIIVSGTAQRYGRDAVILKLNSNGDSLWCKSYDFEPDPWDCQLNDLIVTDDGGFMGVGFFSDQSGPGWTAWMFKTDSNGVVGMNTSTSLSVPKLKIYPNPASSYINFKLPKNHSNKSTITIFNALGQQVYSSKINASTSTYNLNLKSFKAGVYFYELYSDGMALGSGKFVKL